MINTCPVEHVFFPLEPWSGFHFGVFFFVYFALLLCVACWPITDVVGLRRHELSLSFQCDL